MGSPLCRSSRYSLRSAFNLNSICGGVRERLEDQGCGGGHLRPSLSCFPTFVTDRIVALTVIQETTASENQRLATISQTTSTPSTTNVYPAWISTVLQHGEL
jgi:hypothetical protein